MRLGEVPGRNAGTMRAMPAHGCVVGLLARERTYRTSQIDRIHDARRRYVISHWNLLPDNAKEKGWTVLLQHICEKSNRNTAAARQLQHRNEEIMPRLLNRSGHFQSGSWAGTGVSGTGKRKRTVDREGYAGARRCNHR